MAFKKDVIHDKCLFVVVNNMFYERDIRWSPEGHRYQKTDEDGLTRTAWAYLAYGDENLKKGIESCYIFKEFHRMDNVWVSRRNDWDSLYYIDHPNLKIFNFENFIESGLFAFTSRDAVLYSLAAMKLRGNDDFVKKAAEKLNYRISLRYSQTITYNTWLRDLRGAKFNLPLHFIDAYFHLFAAKIYNPLIEKIGEKGRNKIASFINKVFKRKINPNDLFVYGFSWNLMVYMLISSKRWFGLRKHACKILLKSTNKKNIMHRIMLGDTTVTQEEINSIRPSKDYQWMRWQNDFEAKEKIRFLTEEEASYNTYDVDVLPVALEIGRQINEDKNEWIRV